MLQRVVVTAVAVPLILTALFEQWTGGTAWFAFISVSCYLAVMEYYSLFEDRVTVWTRRCSVCAVFILLAGTWIFTTKMVQGWDHFFSFAKELDLQKLTAVKMVAFLASLRGAVLLALVLFLTLLMFSLIQIRRREFKHAAAEMGLGFLPVLYLGIGFSSLLMMRSISDKGPWLVLFLLIIVWMSDSFALISGKLFGKHKLGLAASPNKTVEGLLGGYLFALGGSITLKLIFPAVYSGWALFEWPVYLALTFLLSILSQIGDLLESVLKRASGKKDSGGLIPGHGGVMDVFDGLLFTAPFMFSFVILLGG